jgi:glycosyltransferase involved in cell wall biosynthesis
METNLDGITLLRYAHIYRNRTSGGAEQYLKQLNDGLLAKNRMTILQMHLVGSDSACSAVQVEVEKRGRGQIIWIPVCSHTEERSVRSLPRRLRVLSASSTLATSTDRRPVLSTVRRALGNSCGHLLYSAMILSEGLADLLDKYIVDLIALHWLSYDVGTLVSTAARRRIPYVIIHHFDNGRLSSARTRRLVKKAAAVGGVSNRNVPPELMDRYVNLSDAVDPDFFSPSQSTPMTRPEGFVVLLTSRIVAGKGHADLLLAVKCLVKTGANLSVVFAGAVESESLMAELEKKASLWGLRDRVLFLGELTSEGLRDWYAGSDVVVLPSSSEGLGRVLLEAQAMGKPVIAYDSGGMPDALVANKTGFLVKTGDHAALGERLKHLIDNPGQRFAMGESGRKFVLKNFSISALIQRHEQLYSRVLSEHPCKKS